MRVLFSTVTRGAPLMSSGEIVAVDWPSGQVLARQPVVPSPPQPTDPNPRGNARGGRGITRWQGRLVVAEYHSIRVLDDDLRTVDLLSNGLTVGVHEVQAAGPLLWVASTTIDAAVALDASGRVVDAVWPRDHAEVQRAVGVEPPTLDRTADNRLAWLHVRRSDPGHLHLNALDASRDSPLLLLNVPGAVYDPGTQTVLARSESLVGGHNLVPYGDGWLCNATRAHDLVHLRPDGSVRAFGLLRSPEVRALADSASGSSAAKRALFMRGLSVVGERAFVGTSPAAVIEVDLPTGEVVQVFQYSSDAGVCVHGLHVEDDGGGVPA